MRFLHPIFVIIVIVSFYACKEKAKESNDKPNVIFILADDLGYYDLSCMGSQYYETPNIDRIANEGVTFTHGYAACQVCSPSRASIMSGKTPARHGITDWIGARTGEDWRKAGRKSKLLPPEYVWELPLEYEVLPEAMKENGYKTFFAGKWHIGGEGSWPNNHGFDINVGGWDKGSPIGGYYSPWTNPNLPNVKDGENLSMRLGKETVEFIKAHKDTSFFAFLSFYAVHGPIQTTEEKWSKYQMKAEKQGIPESGFKMGKYLPMRQVQDNPIYAGLVETMDDAVGEVLDILDELGLSENTIIVFTSDNGGVSAGDAFSTSNLPLRGGKGVQYEGGIREPYFMKVPGIASPGSRLDIPASGVDFYPTILDLVGADLKPKEHQDGISLLPALQGHELPDRSLYWHYPHYGNQGGQPSSIIRRGNYKLIHFYEDDREELYNLDEDPYEQVNLSIIKRELAEELSQELFEYLKKVGARFPTKDPLYNEAKEQAYIQSIVDRRLPALEQQRLDFLSKTFDPGNNWWGSKVDD